MRPRAMSRNENLSSSGDIGHGLEYRTSRKHKTSRFAMDNSSSARPQAASQGSKFKDKAVKVENFIRPPNSGLPFEFVKNADNVFVVQTKFSGSQHQSEGLSKEEELVKYMSKLPGFLQRGETVQDNLLNFGVLDWGRLEKWTHNREKTLVSDTSTRFAAGSCSASADFPSAMENTEAFLRTREKPSISNSNSVHVVDYSPVVKPTCGKALNHTGLQISSDNIQDQMPGTCKKNAHRRRHASDFNSGKCKKYYSSHDSSVVTGKSSSRPRGRDHEILETLSRKLSISDGEALKCSENMDERRIDTPHQYFSGKQESIVLLLPKDFSGSTSSEVHNRSSLDGKSAEHNWGSFSDIFSVDEIETDESFTDFPHACPLNDAVATETELDLKLDTLIKAQGIETPIKSSDIPLYSTENKIESTSTSAEISGASVRHRRFGSGIAKMTKSLSFREGSVRPPVSSTYVTAKSGPAKPESQNSNKANMIGKARASPFRRLLDPLFKSKVANQLSEKSNDLRMMPPIPIQVTENEKHEASTITALLYLSVKSGLPLFKFVVEINNEIFASTVKSLSTLEKDNVSWLYTFYSVHKVRKQNGGWKNQRVKPSGFVYHVVGQMKVSEPRFPSWCKQESKGRHKVKESVLYNVDVSKADATTSEFKRGRELAAIVVNMPDTAKKNSSCYDEYNLNDCFSDFEHEKLGHVVVILPGADHSFPREGAPSSLINRWRSGGSCDCGGWDIGCKLRILSDKWQHHSFLQAPCDLYDQGDAKQGRPFFSLIPLRDGLFSVEFDAKISSLQAFSMSVALINSQIPAYASDTTEQVESKMEFRRTKASKAFKSEGPEKHTPHPPLSPVGRV